MSVLETRQDRNFDDIADHFAQKIYGSLKGDIRQAVLQRDLQAHFRDASKGAVLDIGAGLGQLGFEFAKRGHPLFYNDISEKMAQLARRHMDEETLEHDIEWYVMPYQEMLDSLPQARHFSLVLCHALLEWLADPGAFIEDIAPRIQSGGVLSLCFYNPASIEYRNLICGNFNWLNAKDDYRSDTGSLTPNAPCCPEDVRQWLTHAGFTLTQVSGIRVFHDYVLDKTRGGHGFPEQVIEMELRYSQREPFKWMGRYLHFVAQKL